MKNVSGSGLHLTPVTVKLHHADLQSVCKHTTTSDIRLKMYALILLQCIQDYNYIQCYCTKKTKECHCPFLVSYKQKCTGRYILQQRRG